MLEPDAAHGCGFFFGFAFTKGKDHRDLCVAMFADLVVDLFIAGVDFDIQPLGRKGGFDFMCVVICFIGNRADHRMHG